MKAKWAIAAFCAALVAACSTTPEWDTSVFPNQVVYKAGETPPTTASTK